MRIIFNQILYYFAFNNLKYFCNISAVVQVEQITRSQQFSHLQRQKGGLVEADIAKHQQLSRVQRQKRRLAKIDTSSE